MEGGVEAGFEGASIIGCCKGNERNGVHLVHPNRV